MSKMDYQARLDKFYATCRAACDPENQPHQWMGNAGELEHALLNAFACNGPAKWQLCGDAPDSCSYSCDEHLCEMIADDTAEIVLLPDDDSQECCYLHIVTEAGDGERD